MLGFITGSRAYGTPTPESDVDVVVCVEGGMIEQLINILPDSVAAGEYSNGSASLRLGTLNLILLEDPAECDRWRKATENLRAVKPVNKKAAKRYFQGFVDGMNDQQELPDAITDGI